MSYTIAIPTYKRPETFEKKTYQLIKHGKLEDKVKLFIQSDDDERDYARFGLEMVRAPAGFINVCNFMYKHFEMNEAVVVLHDDLEWFNDVNGRRLHAEELDDLFTMCLDHMIEHNIFYGGLYPCPNPYFMKNSPPISHDLRFIHEPVHFMYNMKIYHSGVIQGKADYERTVLYWKATGKIARFNEYSFKTQYNKPSKGGYGVRDQATHDKDTADFLKYYGEFVSHTRRHKSGSSSFVFHRRPDER